MELCGSEKGKKEEREHLLRTCSSVLSWVLFYFLDATDAG
jgi:hypothetical protein